MNLELTEDQIKVIETIAQNEGIFPYKLVVKSATSKGDGYSGSLLNVALKGEGRSLCLILKQAEPTENMQLRVFRRKSYLREIYIYNSVLPDFENFQKENRISNGFTGFARIYGSGDKENGEYLVLEDLKENGFKMWNRRVPMDDKHLAIVFSEYGKFHAISLAMREKHPEKYHELEKHLDDFYSSSLPRDDASLTIWYKIQTGLKAVKGDKEAAKLFERFAAVAESFLLDHTNNADDHLVIMHADCWCNNILFKYEDADIMEPSRVCFVDWQLSKVGSPVLDLAYFFFVCAAGDALHDYNKYLKIYHDAVRESLREFSCNVEKLLPYTLLDRHWRKYAKYGLYTLLMTIHLMLYETEEHIFRGDAAKSDIGQTKTETNADGCNQRIVDVIKVMAEHNLI